MRSNPQFVVGNSLEVAAQMDGTDFQGYPHSWRHGILLGNPHILQNIGRVRVRTVGDMEHFY
jgi:hypothetical protein